MSDAENKNIIPELDRLQQTDGFGKVSQADSASIVAQDAAAAFRTLRRKHRNLFATDPKEFRRQLRKAESRVLRLKPGPKPDPTMAKTARDVAAGKNMEKAFQELYPSNLKLMNPDLYAMALESFKTKVNGYIRSHQHLKNLRDRRNRRNKRTNKPKETGI